MQVVPDGHVPGDPFLIRLTKDVYFRAGGKLECHFKPGDFIIATAFNEKSQYWVASPGGIFVYEAEFYDDGMGAVRKKANGLKERIEKVQRVLQSYTGFKREIDAIGGTPTRFTKSLETLQEYLTKDIAQLTKQLEEIEKNLKKENPHDVARRSFQEAQRRAAQ